MLTRGSSHLLFLLLVITAVAVAAISVRSEDAHDGSGNGDPVYLTDEDIHHSVELLEITERLLRTSSRTYNFSHLTERAAAAAAAAAYKEELRLHHQKRDDYAAWLDDMFARASLPGIDQQPWQFRVRRSEGERSGAGAPARGAARDPNAALHRDYSLFARANISAGAPIMRIPFFAHLSIFTLCTDLPPRDDGGSERPQLPDEESVARTVCDMMHALSNAGKADERFIDPARRPTQLHAALGFHKIALALALVLLRFGELHGVPLGSHFAAFRPFVNMLPLRVDAPACSFTEADLHEFPAAAMLLRHRERRLIDFHFLREHFFPHFPGTARSPNPFFVRKRPTTSSSKKQQQQAGQTPNELLTFPRFMWAMCTIESRALDFFPAEPELSRILAAQQRERERLQQQSGSKKKKIKPAQLNSTFVASVLLPVMDKVRLERAAGSASGGGHLTMWLEEPPISRFDKVTAAKDSTRADEGDDDEFTIEDDRGGASARKEINDGDGDGNGNGAAPAGKMTAAQRKQVWGRFYAVKDAQRAYTAGEEIVHSPLGPDVDRADHFITFGGELMRRTQPQQACAVLELPPPSNISRERAECLAVFTKALLSASGQAHFVYNPAFIPSAAARAGKQPTPSPQQQQQQQQKQLVAEEPQELCLRQSRLEPHRSPERVARLLMEKLDEWNSRGRDSACRTRAALVRAVDAVRGAVERQKRVMDAAFHSVGGKLRARRLRDMELRARQHQQQQQQESEKEAEAQDEIAAEREAAIEDAAAQAGREAATPSESVRGIDAPHLLEIFDYVRLQRVVLMNLLAPLSELATALRQEPASSTKNSNAQQRPDDSSTVPPRESVVTGPYAAALYDAPNANLGGDVSQVSAADRVEDVQKFADWATHTLMRAKDTHPAVLRVVISEAHKRRQGFGLFNRELQQLAANGSGDAGAKQHRAFDPAVDELASDEEEGLGGLVYETAEDLRQGVPAGEPLMLLRIEAIVNYLGLCHGSVGASGEAPPKLCALLEAVLGKDATATGGGSGGAGAELRRDPVARRELQLQTLTLILAHLRFVNSGVLQGFARELRLYARQLQIAPPLPLCSFGREQLDIFPLAEQVLRRRKQLAAQHERLAKHHIRYGAPHFGALPLPDVPLPRYMWAHCHAWSRHFTMNIGGGGEEEQQQQQQQQQDETLLGARQELALVPFLDMANHHRMAPALVLGVFRAADVDLLRQRRGISIDDDDKVAASARAANGGETGETLLLQVALNGPSLHRARAPEMLYAFYGLHEDPPSQFVRFGTVELNDTLACAVIPLPLPPTAASDESGNGPSWSPCIADLFEHFHAVDSEELSRQPRRRVAYEACIRPSKVAAMLGVIARARVFDPRSCNTTTAFAERTTKAAAAAAKLSSADKTASRAWLATLVQRQQTHVEEKLRRMQEMSDTTKREQLPAFFNVIRIFSATQRDLIVRVLAAISTW